MRSTLLLLAMLPLLSCQPPSAQSEDADEVKAAFGEWIDDVNHKDKDKLLSLYDAHADLHPTLSGKLRSSPTEIDAYFTHFLALPNLHADTYAPHIQVFAGTAVNDGFYVFSFETHGKPKVLRARYSFTYLKGPDGWKIIDHHSSVVPNEGKHDPNSD